MISVAQSDYQKLGQNLKANFGHINWASKKILHLSKGKSELKRNLVALNFLKYPMLVPQVCMMGA